MKALGELNGKLSGGVVTGRMEEDTVAEEPERGGLTAADADISRSEAKKTGGKVDIDKAGDLD